MNHRYLVVVICSAVIFPVAAMLFENGILLDESAIRIFFKWFIFFAVGIRLFIAGLKQALDPEFTANFCIVEEIIHSCYIIFNSDKDEC